MLHPKLKYFTLSRKYFELRFLFATRTLRWLGCRDTSLRCAGWLGESLRRGAELRRAQDVDQLAECAAHLVARARSRRASRAPSGTPRVWKSSGNCWLVVCSITRRPAKPITAPGSAIFTSPRLANDAATPPVVGSPSTEIYGMRASRSRAIAARHLGHLHQREHAFLHPRAAGRRKHHDRQPALECVVHQQRDLLADHHAHAAAHEAEIHDRQRDLVPFDLRGPGNDRVVAAGGAPRGFHPHRIGRESTNSSGSPIARSANISCHDRGSTVIVRR